MAMRMAMPSQLFRENARESGLSIVAADPAHVVAQVVPLQRQGDIGLEKSGLAAAVKALAREAEPVQRRFAETGGDGVGELDLAARARLAAREMGEDLGHQDIAADNRARGRGRGGGRGV